MSLLLLMTAAVGCWTQRSISTARQVTRVGLPVIVIAPTSERCLSAPRSVSFGLFVMASARSTNLMLVVNDERLVSAALPSIVRLPVTRYSALIVPSVVSAALLRIARSPLIVVAG